MKPNPTLDIDFVAPISPVSEVNEQWNHIWQSSNNHVNETLNSALVSLDEHDMILQSFYGNRRILAITIIHNPSIKECTVRVTVYPCLVVPEQFHSITF